jgi:hypothetical protein
MSGNSTIGANVTGGEDTIPKRIAALETRVRELASVRSLSSTSIGEGGLRSENFDGDVDGGTVGSHGWALTGDELIVGDIVLRGGIIGNDALTSPISVAADSGQSRNFSIGPGSSTARATASVAVPAGFTRAVVTATSDLVVWNDNSFQSTVNLYTEINGASATFHPAHAIPASTYGSVSSTYSRILTGLNGGTVTANAFAYCANTVPASSLTGAQIYMTVIFLR